MTSAMTDSQTSPQPSPLHPPVPPVSKRNAPLFNGADHRAVGGLSFTEGSDVYQDVRPGYPAEILALASGHRRVLDVGAGTGKLTGLLAEAGHDVTALDPSMDMLRVLRASYPGIPCWQAVAEHTGIADKSVDLITCAQTWHWVDVPEASAEFDRVIAADGAVLLVWNNLDTSIAWVHRLSRIMHAGDVLKSGFVPPVARPWTIEEEVRTTWEQELTPGQIIELAHTRSYWLRSTEKTRAKVDANLHWYLYEHLGLIPGEAVALPYRCDGFLLHRQVDQ